MYRNQNFISANKQQAINTTGELLIVGAKVVHQDKEAGIAIIKSFEINEDLGEVKAHTDKGYAHIDFISNYIQP